MAVDTTGGLQEDFEETPLWVAVFTMIGYGVLFVVGHVRDFLGKLQIIRNGSSKESPKLKVGVACRFHFQRLLLTPAGFSAALSRF
jgi:hypothetical protein